MFYTVGKTNPLKYFEGRLWLAGNRESHKPKATGYSWSADPAWGWGHREDCCESQR